ncbi:MAG: hypothetical protein ACPG1Z_08145 [Planctomycetota bacterium]
MKTVTLAVGLSTLAVLAFMILGDTAISSRVNELEGKQKEIDANFEEIKSSQESMDGTLKESARLIEQNRLQIVEARKQQKTLSDDLKETRETLNGEVDQLREQGNSLKEVFEGLDIRHQELAAAQQTAGEERSGIQARFDQQLEQLRSDLEAASSAMQKARTDDQKLVESLKQQIRDLEQQVQSSSQDRVDLVVRQGQMQKLLEELIQSQEAMQQELEILKSRPLP